jgi:hypothetical protein
LVDLPGPGHVANPIRSAVPLDLSFGDVAPGSLRAQDTYFLTGVASPSSYGGNLVWAWGSSIELSIFVRYADNLALPATMINCGTDTLVRTPVNMSGFVNEWRASDLTLREQHYTLASNGNTPTRAQFVELLSHVTAIYISTEFHITGNNLDDTNIDDVLLPTPLYAGDSNKDGTVNFADLVKLAQNYGATYAPTNTPNVTWPQGDSNGDNQVNFGDLVLLAQNYGRSVSLTSADEPTDADFAADWALAQSLVPEPASLLTLASAVAAVAVRRPRCR